MRTEPHAAIAPADRPATDVARAAARRQGGQGVVLPRHSARCLRYIAEHPGASSAEVQAGIGIRHPSQASAVLHRLERDGLLHTERGRGVQNAWGLTERGVAVLAELPEGIYE